VETAHTPQVFISSTWLDLQPEREAVVAALGKLNEIRVAALETFGSRTKPPGEVGLAAIDASDAYVGIFAGRYGSGSTEAEYRRARERGLPCFIYFKAEPTITLDMVERDEKLRARLDKLKSELSLNHTVSQFTSAEDLAGRVTADLYFWLRDEYSPRFSRDEQPTAAATTPTPPIPEMHPDWPDNPNNADFIRELAYDMERDFQHQLIAALDDGALSRDEARARILRMRYSVRGERDAAQEGGFQPSPSTDHEAQPPAEDAATAAPPTHSTTQTPPQEATPHAAHPETTGESADDAPAETDHAPTQPPAPGTLGHLLAQPFALNIPRSTISNLRYAGELGSSLSRGINSSLFIAATILRASFVDKKDSGLFLMDAIARQLQPAAASHDDLPSVIASFVLSAPEGFSITSYRSAPGWESFPVEPKFYEVLRAANSLTAEAHRSGTRPRHILGAILSPLTKPEPAVLLRFKEAGIDVQRLRREFLEYISREHGDELAAWRKYLAEVETERAPAGATAAATAATAAGATPTAEEAQVAPDAVMRSGASDQPTSVDSLGFTPYVRALAEFLAHKNTAPPLTVSVEGKWGSGKSSFMLQLEEALRSKVRAAKLGRLRRELRGLIEIRRARYPKALRRVMGGLRVWFVPEWERESLRRARCLTVRFNAWRHDKEDALWASFALEFVRQLSRQLTWRERCRARATLLFRRSNWLGWLALARSLLLAVLILFLTAAVVSLVRAGGLTQTLVYASKEGAPEPGKLFGLLVGSAGVAGYVAGLIYIVSKFRDYVGDPFAVNLKQYLESPDYRSRVAFVESFHEDFRKIVETYAGASKVYVFVDDLDRCEVPKSADLMQALNLLISDSSNLIFIIGMDREKVAAGLAVKYEKLLPYLAAGAQSSGATTDEQADAAAATRKQAGAAETPKGAETAATEQPGKAAPAFDPSGGLEYGYAFIEKFIQIPFRVPQPGPAELRHLLDVLAAYLGADGDVAAAAVVSKMTQGPPTEIVEARAVVAEPGGPVNRPDADLSRPAPQGPPGRTPTVVTPPAPPVDPARRAAAEKAREKYKLEASGEVGDSERVRKIALMVAPALDSNPRRLKQFLNLFRLRAYIAANTSVNESITLEQLGKFIAISIGWPRLIANLEDDDKLLDRLQAAATGGDDATDAHAEYLSKRPELKGLFKYGCVSGAAPYLPELYSLERVDVSKLLLVAAPVPVAPPSQPAGGNGGSPPPVEANQIM
jgi:hypothetical protein